jgi:hypothetical protein
LCNAKNFWKKEDGVAIQRPKKGTKHFLDQDYSMIMVPGAASIF